MNLESVIKSIQNPTFGENPGAVSEEQRKFLLDYWNKIQQYKGTQYYQQLLNNPYLMSGYEYQDSAVADFLRNSAWGNVLSGLSFGLTEQLGDSFHNSGLGGFLQSNNQSANEEFDRIIGMMQQNNFNSAAAQSGREIAAGINPALAGVGGEAAVGSPGPDETSSPLSASAINAGQMSDMSQFGSIVSSFFSSFMNMASFAQEFEGKSIANAAGDVELFNKVYETALKSAAGMSSMPATKEEFDALTEDEKSGLEDQIYETLKEAVKSGSLGSMPLNRRARKYLQSMTGRIMYDKDGKPTLAYQQRRSELLKSYYGNTLQAGKDASHPILRGGSEDFNGVIDSAVKFFGDFETKSLEYQRKMMELNEKIANSSAKSADAAARSNSAVADYDEGYYSNELGADDAEVQKLRNQTEKLNKELNSMIQGAMDDLDQYGAMGKIGKILILSIRQVLMSTSVGVSQNKKGVMAPSISINP